MNSIIRSDSRRATFRQRGGASGLAAVLAVILAPGAWAQMGGTIIKDAHVLVGDGREFQEASITISGDTIASVGQAPSGPMTLMAKKIKAEGKYVTPGLVDVWSTLGARLAGGDGSASAHAVDNFDRYAEHELRAALRQGVTAIYVPARASEGAGGLGAVVRLLPGGDDEQVVLAKRAALSTTLGVGEEGTIARVRAAEQLRKDWREAKEYREALDAYEEDLEEYGKELKKFIEKWEKEQAEKSDEGSGEKPEEAEKGEKGDEEKPAAAAAPKKGRRKRDAPAEEKPDAKGDKDDSEKKKDEGPEKPTKPERDADKDVLLEVIDGKLRWRVEAYRPADILNALAIAEEFNLALVLEGASGAPAVAERIAEQEVSVILDAESPAVMYVGGPQRDRTDDAVRKLVDAGVELYIGSGPSAAASANLALTAARVAGQGLDSAAAFKAITGGAAELLGVDDKIGRVSSGMSADLVIWSDHPFAPGAKVERVYIAGKEVYNRAKDPYLSEGSE